MCETRLLGDVEQQKLLFIFGRARFAVEYEKTLPKAKHLYHGHACNNGLDPMSGPTPTVSLC